MGVHEAPALEFYDERYTRGYMQDFSDLYEACRVVTVRETLAGLPGTPRRILDYGCGQGRYIDVVRERFPTAPLVGSDISRVALGNARGRHPDASFLLMDDERVPESDGAFDLIVSVEVLEHVTDADAATREFGRLLAPGGTLVATTPCANPLSLEWWLNRRAGSLQTTLTASAVSAPMSRDICVVLQAATYASYFRGLGWWSSASTFGLTSSRRW